jgi:transcriptional regulator with XRE-family HTH domain
MSGEFRGYFGPGTGSDAELAMVYQNPFQMKQPELGRKVAELRKARGLTQEELVERCNVTVRTIQRIEAGEVTPRPYTLKALFEALGYPWEEAMPPTAAPAPTLTYGYLAFALGLAYFFLAFFEIDREYRWVMEEQRGEVYPFLAIKLGTFFTYAGFLLGWLWVERYLPNRWLRLALWTMLGANVVWYGLDTYALLTGTVSLADFYAVKISCFGLGYILLGLGYWRYQALWTPWAKLLGALGVLAGGLLLSVIGVILGLIPLTLFELGQLILLIAALNRLVKPAPAESASSAGLVSATAE